MAASFADDILKCIFLNENDWILITNSLKFIHKGPINNKPALVQVMAWHPTGVKPLSKPMMAMFIDSSQGLNELKYAHGFVLFCLHHQFLWIHAIYLLIFFRVASLAIHYEPPPWRVNPLKGMDKILWHQATIKHNKSRTMFTTLGMYCHRCKTL